MKEKKKRYYTQYNSISVILILLMFCTGITYEIYRDIRERERVESVAEKMAEGILGKRTERLKKNSERYLEYGIIERSEFDYLITKRRDGWQVYRSWEQEWQKGSSDELERAIKDSTMGVVRLWGAYYIFGGVEDTKGKVLSLWEVDRGFLSDLSEVEGLDISFAGPNGSGGAGKLKASYTTRENFVWEHVSIMFVMIALTTLFYTNSRRLKERIEEEAEKFAEGIEIVYKSRGEKRGRIEKDSFFSESEERITEIGDYLKRKNHEVKALKGKLTKTNLELRALAIIDRLTGVYNKMFLYEFLEDMERKGLDPLRHNIVTMIDLDNFKKLNDTEGHLEGDALLKEVGELLKGLEGQWGTSFRYGGDEFLIIFKNIRYEEFMALMWDLEEKKRRITNRYIHVRLGFSIGGLVLRDEAEYNPDNLIKRVDRLLYKAKKNGKNQLVLEL